MRKLLEPMVNNSHQNRSIKLCGILIKYIYEMFRGKVPQSIKCRKYTVRCYGLLNEKHSTHNRILHISGAFKEIEKRTFEQKKRTLKMEKRTLIAYSLPSNLSFLVYRGAVFMRNSIFKEKFKLNSEQEKQLKSEIKAFYLDVLDEEIGLIKEQQILELFYEHMAPMIYNKALDDAQRWHQQQAENLLSDYYMLYCDL